MSSAFPTLPDDALLLFVYRLGWSNSFDAKAEPKVTITNSTTSLDLIMTAYHTGWIDSRVGDDIRSLDYQTDSQIVARIRSAAPAPVSNSFPTWQDLAENTVLISNNDDMHSVLYKVGTQEQLRLYDYCGEGRWCPVGHAVSFALPYWRTRKDAIDAWRAVMVPVAHPSAFRLS